MRIGGRRICLRAALLVGSALLIVLSACSSPPPALERRDAPPPAQIDPARPCAREAPNVDEASDQSTSGVQATFDRGANKIVLNAGEGVTIPALSEAVGSTAALRELSPGEWLLGANLEILKGASLRIASPDARWLKLSSTAQSFVTIKSFGGNLDISGTCITSWDPQQKRVDAEHRDGRSFLLAKDGAQLTIDRAELRYLGFGAVESYGLSWRTAGTGGRITNSVVSHLYFGLYTYAVGGLVVEGNEFHDNVLYGIDPHTGSHDLRIERNVVHDNGKHGIILAENCTASVIRDNVVYRNHHHGIVLYLHADRNVIEGNHTFQNEAQGINVNESSFNTVRANRVYDNGESGVGVGQRSQENLLDQNEVRANKQDGVRLVSEASRTTVQANLIGENARYGVYIDSDGEFTVAGNRIFNSRVGVLRKGPTDAPAGNNAFHDNREADIKNG